ncbi:hypothetical protein [Rhizohabitans arisaemae]|uniref:hypothetical protein n=1 Tax=Rhizohabitans arisaemae TaxID=2720610 RepID=UPI0024B07275|nr:hypothetical protein [Rhizohabitans arisaemae]
MRYRSGVVGPALVLLGVIGLGVAGSPGVALADKPRAERDRLLFTFKDPRITESSGLAVSNRHPGIVYTHNDSSASARFFAVGPDGRTRASYTVAGATARDWEAMAASKDPRTGRSYLWFGDIGDNLKTWQNISVYRVEEPAALRGGVVRAVRFRFRFQDGPRDAEGIMVHPVTGRLYVVSKEWNGGVYAAPSQLRTDRVNVLRRVGSAPLMATDAAYARDGRTFVIRTYFSASVYSAPDKQVAKVSMPSLKQSESIAYSADGRALLVGSEGVNSPLWRVPLPAEALPKPLAGSRESSVTPSDTPSRRADATRRSSSGEASGPAASTGGLSAVPVVLWVLVAAFSIGVIGLLARRAR